MNFVLLILGLVGGILSGLGLGGGTILIPILISFMGLAQNQAQFLNIISFVFMSFFVVIFLFKNKLIDVFTSLFVAIIGISFAVLTAFFANNINQNLLKYLFACFLIIIGVIQLIKLIVSNKKV